MAWPKGRCATAADAPGKMHCKDPFTGSKMYCAFGETSNLGLEHALLSVFS